MKMLRKMLIVDDVELNRSLLGGIFEDDYAITEAENGPDALAALRREKFNIVLLDIVMPGMDGFQVLEEMKADPALAGVPVVVSTSEKEQMEGRALTLGADDFISKPFDPIVVKKRVENIVVKHVLEREKLTFALHETQSELQSLTDSIPGGILVFGVGEKYPIFYFNDGFCGLCGYSRSEFQELFCGDLQALIYSEDLPALHEEVRRAMEENRRLDMAHRIRYRDGTLRWLRASAVRYRDREGTPVFRSVFIDVTNSKENEILVQLQNRDLRFLLEHDNLTGLHNRVTFCKKTATFLQSHPDQKFVLVQFDVERFKVINELYGNDVGDHILTAIAGSISEMFGGRYPYGRLEADHFVVCLPKDEEYLVACQNTLEDALSQVEVPHRPSLYYGIYRIEDPTMPVDLMCDRANLALRTVKGNYNRNYAIYDESLHQSVIDEQEIASEMNHALESGQFQVYFQPVVSLLSEQPVSAEALVRWIHPTKGMISPGVFIPFFEHNGFIVKLDAYIREEVCRFLSSARAEGRPFVPISVNLSRLEFYDPDLCGSIAALVKKYDLDPSMLRLEITESAYTDNPHQLLDAMRELQNQGFLILMDDFGSGYSSLNMLKDVPVDVLKLDMRFLSGEDPANRGASILAAIIRMAQSLEMVTIAEGIETKDQSEFLGSTGCDYGQGYYYARPMPRADFQKLLAEKNHRIQ